MKLIVLSVSCLLAVTFFVEESTSISSLRGNLLTQRMLFLKISATETTGLILRRLEEDAQDDDDAGEQNDDAAEEGDDNAAKEEDANENEEEEGDDVEEDQEQAEEEAASDDDYVFYDDEALEDCGDDEDCQKAAAYAAYDDEYLANCEEDDEECKEAAAYTTAKATSDEVNETNADSSKSIGRWFGDFRDGFNNMSNSSKIWAVVLIAWFVLLAIVTCFFCCYRSNRYSKSSRFSSLKKSLTGNNNEGGKGDSEQHGPKKFRMFGRKRNKRRSNSKGNSDEYFPS